LSSKQAAGLTALKCHQAALLEDAIASNGVSLDTFQVQFNANARRIRQSYVPVGDNRFPAVGHMDIAVPYGALLKSVPLQNEEDRRHGAGGWRRHGDSNGRKPYRRDGCSPCRGRYRKLHGARVSRCRCALVGRHCDGPSKAAGEKRLHRGSRQAGSWHRRSRRRGHQPAFAAGCPFATLHTPAPEPPRVCRRLQLPNRMEPS